MKAWFVVEWNVSDTKFHGPFLSEEAAMESAKNTKEGDDDVENIAVVGPMEIQVL